MYVTAVFLLLSAGGYALLRTPSAQTWLTQRIAAYLSYRLNTKVVVNGVDIELFKKIVLEGFYVEDLHHDTLLFVEKLKIDISKIDRDKKKFILKTIRLNTGKFYIKQYLGDTVLNFQFIIDNLLSSDTTDTSSSLWKMNCSNLEFDGVAFSYHDFNEKPVSVGIDYSNISVGNIHGAFRNILIFSDTITAHIDDFVFSEKSGFTIKNFSAGIVFSSHEITLKKLLLQTENTRLQGDCSMLYNSFSDFSDFLNAVELKGSIHDSRLNFKDIAFFAPALWGCTQIIDFSGDFKGSINRLKGKNLRISMGNRTYFKGNVSIKGLPDIDNTFIDLIADDFQTTKKDLEKIQIPPFNQNEYLSVPENIAELGLVTFQGRFTGFVSDFVAFGNFTTALGNINSDINLKYDAKTNITNYSGNMASLNFNIGRFLSQQQYLGKVSLNMKVEGSGLSKDKVNAKLTGKINEITLNSYDYKNIELTGEIAKGLFKGTVDIKEEDIALFFNGGINLTSTLPVFDFTADIRKARLRKLNFSGRDSTSELTSSVIAHFTGNRLDNLDGIAEIQNTSYSEKGDTVNIKKIQLAAITENKIKNFRISSDMLNASVKGAFNFSALADVFQEFIGKYLPSASVRKQQKKTIDAQYFDFSMQLGKTAQLSKILFPQLFLDGKSEFSGSFHSSEGKLVFTGTLPAVHYENRIFKNVYIKASSQKNNLLLQTGCSQLLLNDSVWIDDVKCDAQAHQDSIKFRMQLANNPGVSNKADLNGWLYFRSAVAQQIKLFNSRITLDNTEWTIQDDNLITTDSATVHVSNFIIRQGEQYVKADGVFYTVDSLYRFSTEDTTPVSERMNLYFSNFNLKTFNSFLQSKNVNTGGEINGSAFIAGSMEKLKFISDLSISDFAVNGDTLGVARISSSWNKESNALTLHGNIYKGNVKTFEIDGIYALAKEKDNLNFDIMTQKTYLHKFARYLDDYAGNLRGVASANLKLSGSFEEPVLTGKVMLQKTSFTLSYLNTFYNLADEITLSENSIDFNDVTVNDNFGNKAIVKGKILHEHFKNFRFQVTVIPDKFQCLNTTSSQNSLYYGTAYASGTVKILGNTDNVVMDIAAKTEKGTQLFIPLSNPEELSQSTFVSFISHDTTVKVQNKYEADLSGIQLKMEIEATPEAEVQIIFDSKIGDIIKGRGKGNIKMEINSQGNFNMSGDYTIESGDYLFTLQNILNRKFVIEKGGTIKWSGVPYDADINLLATYRKKASLYDFLPGVVDSSYKKPINTECKLNMTGKLLNPNINFGLEVPGLEKDESTLNLFKKYLETEETINNQVVSLLMLGRFSIAPGLDPTSDKTSAVSANASELLSNQLTNWASQISNKFDLGVNYRAGDASGKNEMEVDISKQFFNDRVLVNGTVGVVNNNQSTSNFVGDINVEVKLSDEILFKTYNKSNNSNIASSDISPYTQGAGISYKKEYDRFGDLFADFREKRKKKNKTN